MYESAEQSATATGPSLPVFLLENALHSTSWACKETNSSSTTSNSFSPLNIICIERLYMFTSIGLMLRSMFFCCIQVSSPLSPEGSHIYTWECCYFPPSQSDWNHGSRPMNSCNFPNRYLTTYWIYSVAVLLPRFTGGSLWMTNCWEVWVTISENTESDTRWFSALEAFTSNPH